ncbi:ThiF family adenylyltransferase [Vibrio cholerae]|nr:ThiF family adenylyltransferase [Vibrio cholerae]EGR3958614.1 ThiF family adenylyltransferase [Vibrio cholerae]MBL4287763.1 ThiF family adenylyltransferase [Vibrio fluvialis]MBL4292118.1 ThiF family adenylyltransferase [Vibrio fluvialis]
MLSEIKQHLINQGFYCTISEVAGGERIVVETTILNHEIQLMLVADPPYYSLPEFILINPDSIGRLAHVSVHEDSGIQIGTVCVNAPESLSVNFEQPLLVVEESLRRHISLLEKCITNPDWNHSELLREFSSEWLRICAPDSFKPLLANIARPALQTLSVYSPVDGKQFGIESHYMVHPADDSLSGISDIRLSIAKDNRRIAGKAVVIPIETLTPAPKNSDALEEWYLNTISSLPIKVRSELQQKYGQWRETAYWVVFTAKTVNDERTWFALKLSGKAKKALPLSDEKLKNWKLEALPIRLFNQENTVERGGGILPLADKKVAVIGTGSVGSEIAHKLSAAGVRYLTLVDPDLYEINNLYRHILEQHWVGAFKTVALSVALQRQFPWSCAQWKLDKLMEFARSNRMNDFDLIVIAIGNPTQERLFKQYLLDNNSKVAVINSWLEGFGVGGHATLDIPSSEGCLLCSYVCQETGARGLVSNMNFIEPNQVTMKNIAGCGEQFISYGAASSAQTGVMAANLAIRYLEGKQTKSCKVSWKGLDEDAMAEGIRLTHRYYNFSSSLEYLPLVDEDCDVCTH